MGMRVKVKQGWPWCRLQRAFGRGLRTLLSSLIPADILGRFSLFLWHLIEAELNKINSMDGQKQSKDPEEQELDLEDLIVEAENFVKEKFKNHDPSHDYNHVHRVRLLALGLANCESLPREPDMMVVELAA